MRATERFGILVWLALLLALHVSAQSVQPTLEDTMTFIANMLNSRGIISWTTTAQDAQAPNGRPPIACHRQTRIHQPVHSLGQIAKSTSRQDGENYLVQLQAVSGVSVQSYSRSMSSQSSQWELQFSPDTYLIQIKTTTAISGHRQSYKKDKLKSTANLPNDHAADIQFADEQTATRVADAIRHAAGLCGATQFPR